MNGDRDPKIAGESEPDDWLGQAILRHESTLRGFVRLQMNDALRALESESDILQSTLREVLQHPERVRYRGEAEFRSWLYGAVLNKVRNKLRGHRAGRRDAWRVRPLDAVRRSALHESYTSVLGEVARIDDAERLERAMDGLGDRERAVLARFYFVGQRHAEIADELGLTEVHCRQLLTRAKTALAIELARRPP